MKRSNRSKPPSRLESRPPLSAARRRAIVSTLLRWFAASARDLPWRRTLDPYAIWVSEVMLQQTQVKTVIPYWERWMRELRSIASLAKARPQRILKLWEGLGYYTRARNLQKAAGTILSRHDGVFPTQFDEILALAGIGRYTAGAIASIAFNQPAPIVDGNVIRVLTRLFAIELDPRQKQTNLHLWAIAEQLVHEAARHPLTSATLPFFPVAGSCSALNQSLMELGAIVCTPKQPRCEDCPLRKSCAAFQQNRVEDFPNLLPRAQSTARRFVAFAVECNGRWLVRQRPAGVINARLWEFPNLEVGPTSPAPSELARQMLGIRTDQWQPLAHVRHSITRYRILLDAYRSTLNEMPPNRLEGTRWSPISGLRRLAFSSAHRQLLDALTSRE